MITPIVDDNERMRLPLAQLPLAFLAATAIAFSPNGGLAQVVPGDRVQNARPAAGGIPRAGLGNVDVTFLRTSPISELALPDAMPANDGGIDMPTARAAALNRARRLWGGSPAIQSVVPVFDASGKLVAYDVDFALQPGSWSYAQVATEWQEVLRKNDREKRPDKPTKDAERQPPPQAPTHRFGSVTISANFDAYPVRCAGRGVSNYYASAWVAQNVASQALSAPAPRLVATHWLGPWERAYRFEANGKEILVEGQEPWGWYDYETFAGAAQSASVARMNEVQQSISASGAIPGVALDRIRSQNRAALDRVLSESNAPLSTHYIPSYATAMERFQWTYGCTPTAGAMVLNYWENVSYYGLLNSRFFMEDFTHCHTPTLLTGLKISMGTKEAGGTPWENIYPGMVNFATSKGYLFSGGTNWSGNIFDWHWDDIVSDIDAGYPFIFSASAYPLDEGGSVSHSVAAIGYDSELEDLLVYRTWSTDDATPKYVHHGYGLFDITTGHGPRPGGSAFYDVKLISPDGFQTFAQCESAGILRGGDTTTITWTNFGRPGHHVGLYYSTDGGNGWTAIGTAPDNGSYVWNVPDISTSEGRIYIVQYSPGALAVSEDGSYGNFTISPRVSVTVQGSSAGPVFSVDGANYNSPQTFLWISGSSHTISTITPQNPGPGTRYVWQSWSDGQDRTHNVAPTIDTTFTANFLTQHYLTMIAPAGATVSPAPPGSWLQAGTTVPITASSLSGYTFTGWAGTGNGSYTGPNNPASVTVNGPIAETATYSDSCSVTITTDPPGIDISVDAVWAKAPRTFRWRHGSAHVIRTIAEALIGNNVYFWMNWSDGGNFEHNIYPTRDTTITANFALAYVLMMHTGTGGTVLPATSGRYVNGEVVQISATPNSGYSFMGWTGLGNGSYSGMDNPAHVIMNDNITETAAFAPWPRVTFGVNMKAKLKEGLFRPDLGDIVTLRGSFNDWGNSTNNPDTLRDTDHDSIYTKQISFLPSTALEYKFWKTPRGGPMGWEDGIANRRLTVGLQDTLLRTACFNGECVVVGVTFVVDMRAKRKDGTFRPDLGDVVTLRGSFNEWGNAHSDTLLGQSHDSVYIKQLFLPPYTLYEYKFWKTPRGGSMGYEDGIPNRQIDFGAQDVELQRAYFNNELYPVLHLRVNALLQGPYAGDRTMKKSLNTAGALASHFGAGTFPANSVDSINIEIRNAAVGKEATVRRFAPAWLLTDGSIRKFSDTARTMVDWDSLSFGQYYIVVRHRNHLAVMSRTRYTCDGNVDPEPYDFRLSPEQYYLGDAYLLSDGLYGLRGGDANEVGGVTILDRAVWRTQNSQTGYLSADFNLSGDVSILDRAIWRLNNAHASQVP